MGPSAAGKEEWAKSDIKFSMGITFPQKTNKRIHCGNCIYGVPVLVILLPL